MAAPKTRNTRNADMIEEYRVHLVSAGRSTLTIESVLDLLFRLDRELPAGLAEAYPRELKAWLAQPRLGCGDGDRWSANTIATYRSHMVEFYKWACDEDDPWLTYDPARRLPRPKVNRGVPQPTTDEAVQRIVSEAAEPFRLICILAAYGGLRPIEIADIRREDITERLIVIRRGKGNKPAVIPTEPAVWRAVRDLPPGPLVTRNGQPISRRYASRQTSAYLHRRMGIDTSPRYLRHWHGTWLRRHYDLRVVQERMRHASVATTQIYTAVTEAELVASTGWLPDFTASAQGEGLGDAEDGTRSAA
jgi:integrase